MVCPTVVLEALATSSTRVVPATDWACEHALLTVSIHREGLSREMSPGVSVLASTRRPSHTRFGQYASVSIDAAWLAAWLENHSAAALPSDPIALLNILTHPHVQPRTWGISLVPVAPLRGFSAQGAK
jgi:hypothetical protein